MTETKASSRVLIPVIGVVVIVALAAILGILVSDDGNSVTADAVDGSTSTSEVEALVFGPMAVDGEPLDLYDSTVADPAVGAAAPVLTGSDFSGAEVTTASDRAQLLVFLAHWCPHCQAELPRIVEAMADGEMDRLRVVAVITGSSEVAPNYPPAPWIEREGFTGEILLDDENTSAATAYGLSSYPFLILVDGDGTVIARSAGELSIGELIEFVGQVD